MRPPVKVSVALLTYNHERYFAQAIESVLAQRVNFPYEIVIADDCSTDGAPAIIADYQRRFPDRIRVLPRPRNLGMLRNFMGMYAACRGEYVAILDGDDYWTSPDKLRLQVELLDQQRDLAICFHRVEIVTDGALHLTTLHPPAGAVIQRSAEDLLRGDCIVAGATMLRRLFSELPDWIAEMAMPDWPTFVLHALHGGIGYIDQPMSVYRQHSSSDWTSRTRQQKLPRKIAARRLMAEKLGAPYDAILTPVIERLVVELALLEQQQNEAAA